MQTFRKRPVQVQAVQWNGSNTAEVAELAGPNFDPIDPAEPWGDDLDATAAVRDDLHGGTWVPMYTGDWVIKGVKGEFYPCRAAVFAVTYEPVEPS